MNAGAEKKVVVVGDQGERRQSEEEEKGKNVGSEWKIKKIKNKKRGVDYDNEKRGKKLCLFFFFELELPGHLPFFIFYFFPFLE